MGMDSKRKWLSFRLRIGRWKNLRPAGGHASTNDRLDTHLFPRATETFEFYDTVRFGKQGIVFPHTHVIPGVNSRSELAYQDISRNNRLPAVPLGAPPLAVTIPTVSGATPCFFMCH